MLYASNSPIEAVGFLAPALKETEVKISRNIAIPALALFIGGCTFSYITVIPYILDFLYTYGESAGLVTFLNVMDFVGFVLQFLIAFGLSFQLPLIMYAFTASGMTDGKFWRKNIRYSMVAIVIFGAVITPDGSGITMWFIAGPMIALYFGGLIAAERHELLFQVMCKLKVTFSASKDLKAMQCKYYNDYPFLTCNKT